MRRFRPRNVEETFFWCRVSMCVLFSRGCATRCDAVVRVVLNWNVISAGTPAVVHLVVGL